MLTSDLLPLRNDTAVLREMHVKDAGAYAHGTADRAVQEFAHLPEPEYTEASVTRLIHGQVRDGLRSGTLAILTIARPDTDAFAGSLVIFDVEEDSAELGFWIHPDHRGAGMARAALTLGLGFARRSGITRLRARTVPANVASQRVLGRTGWTHERTECDTAPSGQEATLMHFALELGDLSHLPLVTQRLRLRLHDHADARALQRIYARPEVARYLLDEPWTADDAFRALSTRTAQTGVDHGSTALALAIEHEDRVVGDVLLWLTDPEHGVAEIGWVLDSECAGQGLATEAVRAVLDMAFQRHELHRVAAQMDARNHASARLAERAGMRREAHLRENWWSKGEWTDTCVYARLASD